MTRVRAASPRLPPRNELQLPGELESFGVLDHRGRRWWLRQDLDELFGVRKAACAHARRCRLEVVRSTSMLDIGAENRPVGTGSALVWHADTAGVRRSQRADVSVVLRVRMAADEQLRVDLAGRRKNPRVRGARGQQLLVTPRRTVAEVRRSRPSMSMERPISNVSTKARSASVWCAAIQPSRSVGVSTWPSLSSSNARSAFPRTYRAETSNERTSSSVASGSHPHEISPVQTTRSTSS